MRDYKFRGKRLDTGEWVYGHYSYRGIYGDPPARRISWIDPAGTQHDVIVDPDTVGQCIGRLRGTKDIHEGDWVHTDYNIASGFTDQPIYEGVVEYSELHACFGIRNGILLQPIGELTGNKWKVEAIDNIHDNPTLLSPKESDKQ